MISMLVSLPWEELLLAKLAQKSNPIVLQKINSFIPIAYTNVSVLCQKERRVVILETISSAWNLSLLKLFCKPNAKLLPSWLHQARTPTQLSSPAFKLANGFPQIVSEKNGNVLTSAPWLYLISQQSASKIINYFWSKPLKDNCLLWAFRGLRCCCSFVVGYFFFLLCSGTDKRPGLPLGLKNPRFSHDFLRVPGGEVRLILCTCPHWRSRDGSKSLLLG